MPEQAKGELVEAVVEWRKIIDKRKPFMVSNDTIFLPIELFERILDNFERLARMVEDKPQTEEQ